MLSLVILLFGLAGTACLWTVAWVLFKGPSNPRPGQTQLHPQVWTNEPTPSPPARSELAAPPDWLFEEGDQAEAMPQARARTISNANTQFFNRDEIDAVADATQILDHGEADEDRTCAIPPPPPFAGAGAWSLEGVPGGPPPPPVAAPKGSRKTWFMSSNAPSASNSPPRGNNTQPIREEIVLDARGGESLK